MGQRSFHAETGKAWGDGEDEISLWKTEGRVGMIMTIDDKPGALAFILTIFAKHGIGLTQIHSKPLKKHGNRSLMNIHVDFQGEFDSPLV